MERKRTLIGDLGPAGTSRPRVSARLAYPLGPDGHDRKRDPPRPPAFAVFPLLLRREPEPPDTGQTLLRTHGIQACHSIVRPVAVHLHYWSAVAGPLCVSIAKCHPALGSTRSFRGSNGVSSFKYCCW